MDYTRVVRWASEQPWALLPSTLATLVDVLRFRASGGRLTQDEIRDRIEAAVGPKAERPRIQYRDQETGEVLAAGPGQPVGRGRDVVAVLGVVGLISQRASQVDDISGPGGTSIERLTAAFRGALADSSVKAIIFDIDSPGGGVYGVPELADEIRRSRGQKPITAVANSLAASAAYWLASAADEVVVTPSGEAGSIGVYAAHEDISGMLEQDGVKVTLVSAGKYKTEGNPFEPLSDEARDYIQGRVDEYAGMFHRAVSAGRGVAVERVRTEFGQGRVFGAQEGVARGLADRVGTLDETIRKASRRSTAPAPERAQAEPDSRRAALERLRTL